MTRILTLILTCVASIAAAQSGLNKSGPLNAERTQITGEFNKAQGLLRAAKTDDQRKPAYAALVAVVAKARTLQGYIDRANKDVIEELNRKRGGSQSRSATIKTVTEKLSAGNQALLALPLPEGPEFTAAEINQIQRVLDSIKTTLELHNHACQNLK